MVTTDTSSALMISETLTINAVVWIRSLPEDHLGPTRRILEDLEVAGGFPVTVHDVEDGASFLSALRTITDQATAGLRPILHIAAHGSEDDGIQLAPSGEHVSWMECMNALRPLNVATQNNLVCIFALCFGLHLYKHVRLSEPVPAYLFCAPPSEITFGFLEEQTVAFYREMNRTSNATESFRKTLGNEMQSFHCQGLFLQSLAAYIRNHASAAARQARLEPLVTEKLNGQRIERPNRAQLRRARAQIKQAMRPGPALINQFAPSFLIGRPAAFDYAQVQKLVRAFQDR